MLKNPGTFWIRQGLLSTLSVSEVSAPLQTTLSYNNWQQ